MNDALYCRNGHFLDLLPTPDRRFDAEGAYDTWQLQEMESKLQRLQFCSECGEAAVAGCEHCKNSITVDDVIHGRPSYCSFCGNRFPWTEASLVAAKEYADEMEELSSADKEKLKATFVDLSADTPRTPLAASRFKKIIAMVGPASGEVLKRFCIDFATDVAKKLAGL
jgi:hypothetical protein